MSVNTSRTAAARSTPKSKVGTKVQPSQSDASANRRPLDPGRSVATYTSAPVQERDSDANEKTLNTKRWVYRIVSVACFVVIAIAAAYVLVLGAFLRRVSTRGRPGEIEI